MRHRGVQNAFRMGPFFLCLLCAGKQEPAANDAEVATSQTTASFHVQSNVIQVPVVVRDKDGHAVGGLQADDFRLTSDGKQQLISRFLVEKMDSNESLKTRGATSPASGGPAVTASLPDRFVAYLPDDLNLAPEYFGAMNLAAQRHINTLRPSDRAAVYSTSGAVHQDFIGDHDQLRKAFQGMGLKDRIVAWTQRGIGCTPLTYYRALQIIDGDPAALQSCNAPPPGTSVDPVAVIAATSCTSGDNIAQRDCIAHQNAIRADAEGIVQLSERDVSTFLTALDTLINKMSDLPGERQIVILSPGFYIPKRYWAEEEAILAKAIRARVVISAIDVRGVYISWDNFGPDPTTSSASWARQEMLGREATLQDFASGTGGVFLKGNNDLDLQLRRAASVPEYMYLLSFSPPELKFDGKQHSIGVSLRNSRGYSIQARGNYRDSVAPDDPAEAAKQELEEAFFSSREVSDLPVKLQTEFFLDGASATLTANAGIDLTRLPLKKQDGRNLDHLTMLIGVFDNNGNSVAAYEKQISLALLDSTLAAWMKAGLTVKTDFSVAPGKYLVRLLVRDSGGQMMAEHSSGVAIP